MGGELGLPEPFRVADFEGSTNEWLQRCRWQFDTIVDGHIEVLGKPVLACNGDPAATFLHTVTKDRKQDRWLDLRRCEIIGQVWDLLERLAAGDLRACYWYESHSRGRHGGRQKRVMVAPVDFRFVVVLKECRDSFLFVTAYPIGLRDVGRKLERAARLAA
jgi:hypothetical protein